MRDDLLHARASVDWAATQFPSLERRINGWLTDNLRVDFIDHDTRSDQQIIVAVLKEPLPLAFTVEIGAYVNAIRASLDILASTLAKHLGACDPKKAYFPHADSERIFLTGRGYKGCEFVAGLPVRERGVLETLKPYKGGNALFSALHNLDIERKHRRLIDVVPQASTLTFKGLYGPLGLAFEAFEGRIGRMRGNYKPILGTIPRQLTKPNLNLAGYVAFDEPELGAGHPVETTLGEFASFANSVIGLFDKP